VNFGLPEVSFLGVTLQIIEQHLLNAVKAHAAHVAGIRSLKQPRMPGRKQHCFYRWRCYASRNF
jgi:hypothetical protein